MNQKRLSLTIKQLGIQQVLFSIPAKFFETLEIKSMDLHPKQI